MEIDFTGDIQAAKKGKAPLNKPFRLPSGSKKKFGVYVKNDKGNIVKVTFGDPNMSIKRDNPERRKAYRSRHGCDNPGPKYKANYWSCKMWSAKPVSKITGSCGKPNCGSVQNSEEETTLEIDVQAKNKGLWYNIQQKKKRMGKNYRPAPEGSKDRPSQEALKKAQGEEYEWDGETEFDQAELLKLDPSLAQAPEMSESPEEELEEYKDDFYGMIVGSINSIYQHAKNVMEKVDDPMVKENLTEPFLQQMAALAEDYMITIHNYVMFNKENQEIEAKASTMFKVGDKVKNVNAVCKHYGSEGIVKEIRDLPEDMGYAVVYECTNDGATWKKGDMIGKTEIQLKKIKASEDEIEDDYDMEEDEDYKGMMLSEGQKFNEFLKQCIPTKQGDDKSKFKSCLEDYRKNK
jgi:hypothetical protein